MMSSLEKSKTLFADSRDLNKSQVALVIKSYFGYVPIGWRYELSHDGYDRFGPKSNLHYLFIVVYHKVTKKYQIHQWHYEKWFHDNDETEFKYWGEMSLLDYRQNRCYFNEKHKFDYQVNQMIKKYFPLDWVCIQKKEKMEKGEWKEGEWNDIEDDDCDEEYQAYDWKSDPLVFTNHNVGWDNNMTGQNEWQYFFSEFFSPSVTLPSVLKTIPLASPSPPYVKRKDDSIVWKR